MRKSHVMGPLHDPVTWYKITDAGEQVAQWDFQNNGTRTSPPGSAFVLEVPLCNLLTSICDFVPCDRIVQRAYLSNKNRNFFNCAIFTSLSPRTSVSPAGILSQSSWFATSVHN